MATVGPKVEGLEDRSLLSFTALLSTNDVTFTGDAAGDTLTFDVDGSGNLRHNRFTAGDAGFNSDIDLDSATAGDQTLLASSVSSLTINAGDGDDTITLLATLSGLTGDLTINGGVGNDTVNLNADITFASGESLDVDLQNDDATPGTDIINVGTNANLVLSGTGAATLKASQNIALASGSSVVTVNGNLIVQANQQVTPTSGSFFGVDVNGGVVESTGTGIVTVLGKGGNAAGGLQHGVFVRGGGQINGGTTGSSTVVTGTGGAAVGDSNIGVYVDSASSKITSGGGNVSVTGTGGGTGTSQLNSGVAVGNTAQITSGGATSTVTVTGTGGAGSGSFNHGVLVVNTSSKITSGGGAVSVTGTGGGTGTSGTSTGVSVSAAGQITSGGGNVSVTGTGGTGSGGLNHGVLAEAAGQITSGGATGTVTVTGTGGASSGNANVGVYVKDTSSAIMSGGGNVSVMGTGGGTGTSSNNHGVLTQNGGQITSGGATGTVSVTGTGGASSGSDNVGVFVSGTSALITSSGGNVSVTGTGGGTGTSAFNHGVLTESAGQITSGGTSSTVTVTGTGGASSGNTNVGVWVNGASAVITSGGGNVSVTGTGGGTGTSAFNHGVLAQNGGQITSGGATGTVSVTGTGGASSGSINAGVFVTSTSSMITSGGGNVSVTGTGGGTGASTDHIGVTVQAAGKITSGGTAATVTVVGTGGNLTGTGSTHHGVLVDGAGSTITSGGGDVSLTGTAGGGAGSSVNRGLQIQNSASIVGVSNANVTLVGTGGLGTGNSHGVRVVQNASVTAVNGNISITGSTTDGTTASQGLTLSNAAAVGAKVETTGTGTITVIADRMAISTSGVSINAGANSVTLLQKTSGVGINLGSAVDTTANTLELSDAELDIITAGTINIGNANSGTITFSADITRAANTNVNLTTGSGNNIAFGAFSLNAGSGGDVSLTTSGSGAITTGDNTGTDITGDDVTLNAGSGGIGSTSNFLRLAATTVTATTSGNGSINLAESGSVTIGANDLNAGTGTVTLGGGTFLTTATGSILSPTTVASGATLGGTGTTAAVTTQSGGNVAPGTSPGTLNTGNVTLVSGSNFNVEAESTSNFDKLVVTGTVSLGNATLNVATFGTPVVNDGDEFVIIDNNGTADAVTGTFNGLAAGAVVSSNFLGSGKTARITYVGGDGNDVVIVVDKANVTSTVPNDGNANAVSIVVVGDTVQLISDGVVIDAYPLDGITNLTVTGVTGQNDTLTVDLTANPDLANLGTIFFNGGGDTADKVAATGTAGGSDFVLSFDDADADSGTLAIDGVLTIDFDGVGNNTITIGGTVDDLTIDFGDGAANIVFTAVDATTSQVAGTGFVTTTFNNPASSLTVTLGADGDSVTFTDLADNFNPSNGVTVTGGAGADSIIITDLGNSFGNATTGSLTLSGGGGSDSVSFGGAQSLASLTVTAETITQTAALTVSGTTTVDVGGTGSATLTQANNFATFVATGGDIDVTDSGAIILGAISATTLDVIAGGAVTQSAAATVTGATTMNAGANPVTLTQANDFQGNVSASGSAIQITDANNLAVGLVAATTTVTLTATAGAINDGNAGADNVTGTSLTASAATGINLDTAITTLTSANVSGIGAIDISDSAGGLTVTSATTNAGNITLAAAGGDLTLTLVTAGTSGDVQATTTTSGNILVGDVQAIGDAVTLNAAGAIEESGSDGTVDIDGEDLNLTAATGIGALATIEIDAFATAAHGLTASVTGTGPIDLADDGNIRVLTATTNDGAISLSAAGTITVQTSITANGNSRNVSLTTTSGGDVVLTGTTTAASDQVTITSAGAINGAGLVTAATIDLNAASGIGNTTQLELAGATITADTTNGNIDVDNALATAVSASSLTTTSGSVTFDQSGGGNITFGTVTATTTADLDNSAGNVALDGSVTAADLIATATGTITDGTTGDFTITNNANFGGSSITLGNDAGNTTNFGSLTTNTSATNGDQNISEDSGLTAINLNAGTGNVTLNSAGTITDGDAGNDITGTTATVTITSGDFGATGGGNNSIDTSVTNLNVDTSAANGSMWIDEASGLSTINLQAGTGNITLQATATVLDGDANNDITATTVTITLTGGANFGATGGGDNSIDTSVVNLNVNTNSGNGSQWIDEASGLSTLNLDADNGSITLVAGSTIVDGDASRDIRGATVTVTVTSGDFGATGGGNNSIDTTTTNLNVTTSGANGSQWIDEADGLSTISLQAGTGNVTLLAGSTVVDGDASNDITGTTATVTVTSGNFGATGGGNNSIDTSVTNLNVNTAAGNGTMWIDEASGLSTINLQAGTGNVILLAASTVVDGDASLDIQGANANVTITSGDFGATGGGDNSIDTSVTNLNVNTSAANGTMWIDEASGLSTINLNAGTGNVILLAGNTVLDGDAGLDVQGTTASVTITSGDFGATGGGDNSIDTSVTNLNVDTSAANGTMWIDEASGLSTINLQAGTGNITLQATATVLDGDANNDITATTVTITLTGGANFGATGGGDNSIDTSVVNLNVSTNSGNGSQWIDEASGLTTLNLDADNGSITLVAGSTIVDGDASLDIRGATVTVTVTSGDFGATGGGNNNIDTSVTNLNVNTSAANGTMWIDEASGLSTINLNAGTGNVILLAGSTVVDGDAGLDITGTTANVTVTSGDFGATGGGNNSIGLSVTNLVTNTAGANGNQFLSEADSLTWNTSTAGTGSITLTAGTFLTGASQTITTSGVTVASGVVLGGTGTITGSVTTQSGGDVSPGTSPGILNTGNLTLVSGSDLNIELNGTTVGTQYDQVNVTGTVSLGNANLNATLGYVPAINDAFTIINNDGGDAVSGVLNVAGNPVAQGGSFIIPDSTTTSDQRLTVDYAGGTGNDVVLTVQRLRVELSVSANAGTEAGTTVITVTATAEARVNGNQTIDVLVTGTDITIGDFTWSNSALIDTTITILSGTTSAFVTFTIDNDQLLEGTQTATLSLANPSSRIMLGTTTTQNIVITDNETGVVDFQPDQANAETVDPTVKATLTITPNGTGTVGLETTFNVTATNAGTGSATAADLDTPFGSQVLTFAVGNADGMNKIDSSLGTIDVASDRRLEGDQTVDLTIAGTLSSTLNSLVSINDATHTDTITDDEIGVINFQADQNNAESVDPTIRAILTITPTGTGTVALEPQLTVVASEAGGGSATLNVDYQAFGPATLTFSANSTADGSNNVNSSTATLDVVQDRRTDENPETVNFGLGTLSSTLDGQTSLNDITHTATITDDDSITIAGAATVNEASPYNVVLTVSLSPTPDATTDITVNWDDGTPSTTITPMSNGTFTIPHVYTDGMPTDENITVDLTEDPTELAGGDITYLNQANAFTVRVLNVAPTLDVLYGPVTYTGTQLNNLINQGVASAPSGSRSLTGSRLDFTGTLDTGVLFRLPLTPANRLQNGDSVEFTVTTNWDNLSADADLGFAITDGTTVIGGNFGQTSAANSFFWLETGTDAGTRVNPVLYPNVAMIDRSMPFTVVVSVTATGVTVRGTNNLGATFLYNTTSTFNLANSLSLILTSDNVGESYGINTMFVQAVGSAGIFTNSGPINEGSSGTVFFSRTPFDPSPEDRAAPLKYSYDFDNDGTWDVGDGTYAGGVLASSVSVPASFNDGTVTRQVRGRVIDKDFAFDDDGDTLVNTDGNQTADPGESNDNFSDYITNVVINNVAPTIALTGNTNVNEGSVYTLNLGAITDPGQDTVTAYSINWGDGTAVENFVGNPTGTMATHTFADGSIARTITVSLTDEDGTFVSGTKVVTVDNVAPTIAVTGAANVNEGSTYTLTLGAITDPGTDTVGFYAVNWGDGAVTSAYAHPSGLMLTHVYTDGPANRTITVTLSDEDATHLNTGSLSVTVDNVSPTIALIGASSVVQGSTYTLTLGPSAIDPGQDTVSAYSIDWGDGSPVENFTGLPNNAVKTHLYPNAITSYTITVMLTDEDGTVTGGTKMVSVTAVPDPTITLNGAATTNEGSVYTLQMGAVANPGTIASYSINWGDGVTENFSGSPANTNKTHTYADGAAAGTARTITVSVTNGNGTFTAGTFMTTVNNVAPTIALTGTGTATTGVAYSLNLGAVTDPGTDTITGYSINWGDGSAVENFVGSPVGLTKMHTYASASAFTITVSLTDEDGTFTGGTSMVTVTAAAPAIVLTGNATTDEGAVYTLNLGAVTNGGTITAHSINWGDGTIDNFSGSPASTMQTHTYADGAAAGTPRTITVSITNGSGTFAAGTLGVTVNNVAPTIVVTGAGSVNEGSTYTLTLGAITDPGTDTVGFYAVNWGDGAVTSAYAHPSGLMLTHVYTDGPATRNITVTLSDEDATHLNTGTLAVMVNNVAPTIALSGSSSAVQGVAYSMTLGPSAIDPGQDTVSAYSIDWGDGSAVENFTGLPNNAVKTHTYASLGNFTITVMLTDEDGTVTGGTKMISVNAAPAPTIALTGAATTNEGSLYTLMMGAVANPGTITSYSINWGDGVTDNFSGSPENTNKTHTYADGAAAGTPRTITVSVTNGSGTFTAGTLATTVNNVGPTIVLTGTGTGTAGVAYSLNLGAITDPGTDTITGYSINWGDGSPADNFSGSPVGLTKMHTYASSGSYTVTVSLTDEDGTFTGGTHAVSIGAVPAPPVGFGPTTYTGTDMNNLIGGGGATAPTGTRVLTGAQLEITGTKTDAIVFQLPLFTAGTFTAADSVTFTTTVDWTMLTADNDFGIGITDGVKVIAGQEADNGKFWLEQANYVAGNNSLTSVAYPASANLARTMPFTVTITVTPSGVKVRGTNAAGVTFQHNSTSTINLANALSVVLLSNTPGEKYGINSMTVQAVKAGATLSSGLLTVNGTGANDTLLVRKSTDGTQVIVESTYNGGATTSASFAIGSVTSVLMNLGTGDDKGFVRNNGSAWAMPSTVNGEDGNDLIVTAEGNDTINGGRGKDFIIGGLGADVIDGGAGEDAIIGGSTSFDSNTTALNAFMTEWTSANSYATRLTNLQNGTGATAGNKLIGNDGATQTVFADSVSDTLTGGADTDAFWANLVADNGGALDVIADLVGGETTFDTDL